ncbi:MAG TPA: hypothetical protein VMK42_19020 [Anaeromyxobacteraceae bacterium]|nr:hypothetical protein [Anaeromyxobacteraceae bacterium]
MRFSRALPCAFALSSLVACSGNLLPPSYLDNLRVLAILATPLQIVLDPSEPPPTIALTPVVYPAGSLLTDQQSWSFCPVSAGSIAAYACAVPACALPSPNPDGSVVATAADLESCYPAESGAPGLPAAGLSSPVETTFTYTVSSVTASGTETRVAVLQLPLYLGPLPPGVTPNRPPAFQAVEIGGVTVFPAPASPVPPPVLPNGGSVDVHVAIDPASVDTYLDADGRPQVETITVDFYATAGRFASDLATGLDNTVALQGTSFTPADLEAGTLEVYVVALDLRGGQAVVGPVAVAIAP